MKQFKALIIKEWHTHKHVFLVPIYTVLTVCILFLGVSIFGVIKYGPSAINFDLGHYQNVEIPIWITYMIVAGIIGLISVLVSAISSDYMINKDHERKCEILHFSQPCSLVKILAAKLTFGIFGMLIQYLLLLLFSYVVISLFFVYLGFNTWKTGFVALFKPFPLVIYSMIMLSAFSWISANLFKKRTGLKLISILIVIEILREIVKYTWDQIKIPSPYLLIGKTFMRPISSVIMPWGTTLFGEEPLAAKEAALHLTIAILIFIAGYYINKNRELS